MDTGAWWATVHWVTRVGHDLVTKQPPPPQNIIPVINIHIRGKHPWNKLMFTIKVFTMKMIALLPNITLSTTVSPSPSWLEKSSPVTGENRLSRWLSGKESACQYRRSRLSPWVGKIPWKRKWQLTPVFLPGKSHGQRSLEATVHGVAKSQI